MTDFIEELKNDIVKAMPDIQKDWAEYCAIATLSTFLSKVEIPDQEGILRPNLLFLNVSPSGIGKTKPMMEFTYPIVKKASDLIEKDFLLPSKTGVEGFIWYVNKYSREEGIVIRDEFSSLFKEAKKSWQSDALEFVSEMYDGNFQKRVTIGRGIEKIERLYASLISCSTYYFIGQMDKNYFQQGTGNRFLYCCSGFNEYEVVEHDPEEYFRTGWTEKREETITRYATLLYNIYKRINEKPKQMVYVLDDGKKPNRWVDYDVKCKQEWKDCGKRDPFGWDFYPVMRYPAFVLKLGAMYRISKYIDKIPNLDDNTLSNFFFDNTDFSRAISLIERNRKYFDVIKAIKREQIPDEQPMSYREKAMSMLQTLRANGGMMLLSAWYDAQTVESNQTKIIKMKDYLKQEKFIETKSYSDLKPEEKTRVGEAQYNCQVAILLHK
jgi:hypothetical protein